MVINIKQNIYCFQYLICSGTSSLSMQFRKFMFNCYVVIQKDLSRKMLHTQNKGVTGKIFLVTPLERRCNLCTNETYCLLFESVVLRTSTRARDFISFHAVLRIRTFRGAFRLQRTDSHLRHSSPVPMHLFI